MNDDQLNQTAITTNKELMEKARQSLKGNWGISIAGFIIFILFNVILQLIPVVGNITLFFISGSMYLGLIYFTFSIIDQKPQISLLFKGLKYIFKCFGAYFMMAVFIILWSLLLIIPGIIACFAYSMTFFIIAQNPTIGVFDAIKQSKELMYGYKWKFFCLGLRFFGWFIVGLLTLGIAFIFIFPYYNVSIAHFYKDISSKNNNINK